MKSHYCKSIGIHLLISFINIGMLLLYSCDVVKPPDNTMDKPNGSMNPVTATNGGSTTSSTVMLPSTLPSSDTNFSNISERLIPKTLIEKYTAFRCGWCPSGTDVLKEIETNYPNNVISINIHASSLAVPIGGIFSYDFRTVVGTTLDNQFRATAQGTPTGMVNRTSYNSSLVLDRSVWKSAVIIQNTRALDVAINLVSYYSSANRSVKIRAEVEYLKNQDMDNYLVLYIVENDIVQPQIDYRLSPTTINNYTHNRVLRGSINTVWGTQLSTIPIQKGRKIIQEFTSTLSNEYKEKNCSIIAVVYKYNTTWQVLQSERVKIAK